MQDKTKPDTPIFDVKTGSLTISTLTIEHFESSSKTEKGIINFISEADDTIPAPALSITSVTFNQRDWKATLAGPFITFSSETATFTLTSSIFNRAKISSEGVTVKNTVGFTFSTNTFIDISGSAGTENLVHLIDVKPVGTYRLLTILENEFINIGKKGDVNDVLFIEQTG